MLITNSSIIVHILVSIFAPKGCFNPVSGNVLGQMVAVKHHSNTSELVISQVVLCNQSINNVSFHFTSSV